MSDHSHPHGAASGRAVEAQASGPWPHSSDDPTATKTLRSNYAGEMFRRFRALKGAIRTSVVERDAFGLGQNRGATQANAVAANQGQDAGINISPAGYNEFDFPSDERRVRAFNEWLARQVDRGILEARFHERDVTAAEPWQNVYLRSSYEKGVTHADAALNEQGVIAPDEALDDVFRATKHADAAGMLFTRAYNELDGVTSEMSRQMSRELTEGFLQGENPRKIARRLNDRVDNVGLHRGRLIARTETIRAHNEGALNRYEDVRNRLDGVTTLAEHVTAGDARVCPVCATLAGSTYKLDEARGRIPVHPNCRCTWVPVTRSS